jgi:hypothetical protein
MMKPRIKLIATASIALLAQSSLACDYPEAVKVPNGATATKEEMLAGKDSVQKFVNELNAYMECIVEEEKLARLAMEDLEPEVEQQREEMLNKKYNAAVDDQERVAASFNTELRAFKDRGE